MKLLRELKLTLAIHNHLHKMELLTVDDLKKECERQHRAIPDEAVCRTICSDCQEALWIAREEEEN